MRHRWDRINADLRDQITAGQLVPGQQLEPVTYLAAKYRVSRRTIARAMRRMEAQGLIDREPEITHFVAWGALAKLADDHRPPPRGKQ